MVRRIGDRAAGRRHGRRDGCAVVAGAPEPAGEVVGVADHRAGGRGLRDEAVERVVSEGDGCAAGAGLARQDIAVGIVGVGLGGAAGIGAGRQPIEAVVGEGGGVAVGAGEGAKLAVGGPGLRQQRIDGGDAGIEGPVGLAKRGAR